MKWALVENDIVKNVIVYDEQSSYTPPEGQSLIQVNDWIDIGENINLPEPTIQDNIEKLYNLEQRKEIVMNSLVLKRDSEINKNITVGTNEFFADESSVKLIHEALTMEGLGIKTVFPSPWLLPNGTPITVTYDDMKALASAIATRKDAAFTNYMTLAAQIASSDSPESIDITTGWPE